MTYLKKQYEVAQPTPATPAPLTYKIKQFWRTCVMSDNLPATETLLRAHGPRIVNELLDGKTALDIFASRKYGAEQDRQDVQPYTRLISLLRENGGKMAEFLPKPPASAR